MLRLLMRTLNYFVFDAMFYIYSCTIRAVNQYCEVDRRYYNPARRLHINCKNPQLPDAKKVSC